MRLSGKKPAWVCINDFPCDIDWHKYSDAFPTICTHGDRVSSLDMRFLHGIGVTIASESKSRAKALFELCKGIGASRVAAMHVTDEIFHNHTGWIEVFDAVS